MADYQSEAQMETGFLTRLIGLGHAPDSTANMPTLPTNLRLQPVIRNNITLSGAEFSRVLNHLDKSNVFERTKALRGRMHLARDGGTSTYLQYFNSDEWTATSIS